MYQHDTTNTYKKIVHLIYNPAGEIAWRTCTILAHNYAIIITIVYVYKMCNDKSFGNIIAIIKKNVFNL